MQQDGNFGFDLLTTARCAKSTCRPGCPRFCRCRSAQHALAEIRDGASGKPAQFRCLCFGLAMLRVPGHEIIQPEAQLSAICRRKLRDGLLDFFQGHQRRIAVGVWDLNPDGLPVHRLQRDALHCGHLRRKGSRVQSHHLKPCARHRVRGEDSQRSRRLRQGPPGDLVFDQQGALLTDPATVRGVTLSLRRRVLAEMAGRSDEL